MATVLPGPPNRSNAGSADCSPGGLLAYGAGSSVVVVDPHSMQLLCALPMPSPSAPASALASFVTSVRWLPQPLPHLDLLAADDAALASSPHLHLAAGDRHGRVAIWDVRSRRVAQWLSPPEDAGGGVQDLCWIRGGGAGHGDWLLASIHGPSMLLLWDVAAARCRWIYDASPEYLSCLRRDPFDSRHLCALGLRGFLLSAIPLAARDGDVDVSLQEHRLACDAASAAELQKLEKDLPLPTTARLALADFPQFSSRLCFSPLWQNVVFIAFPRELIVFDLHYGTKLASASLPRGCGKFMDILADSYLDLLYCLHLDGKLTIWKRKEGEQARVLCAMEELLPSIGTPVPAPSILALTLFQLESYIQYAARQSKSLLQAESLNDASQGENICNDSDRVNLLSISDDGKIWRWLLIFGKDGNSTFDKKKTSDADLVPSVNVSNLNLDKVDLIGQLHLLSSTVTTFAVPFPSLLATLARGGSTPAPAVALVTLGTQNGTIEVVDIHANSVASSISVHNSPIRGLRWLGNSRLVSFSYNEVNDKDGGYNNKLVLTCLRSGLNRQFRNLQKPERAPIKALRTSSSGRYLVIMLRDAPVEVWAMTKNPVMLRSLALPFTVLEWTLPSVPRPGHNIQLAFSKEPPQDIANSESSDETSESFAFALVNGALGVFEVQGRRIRDFRPKWPSTFAASEGMVTAIAFRYPHVVLGDRSGNIRWWDVTTGISSSFSTYREGIRRIKFSPVASGDRSRGRIAVLFYDNTFSIFDLDTPDPLANALLQPQSTGTLVLELDWLPIRTSKDEPLVLCIAGADSSFRLIEVNINDRKFGSGSKASMAMERYRPMPLCLPLLLPTAHALALRMILQSGVKPSWFNSNSAVASNNFDKARASHDDFRSYMIQTTLPVVGDAVVSELLLKILEPYRKDGHILDNEMVGLYASILNKGSAARFGFASAVFGDFSETLFWLRLPEALNHFLEKSARRTPAPNSISASVHEAEHASVLKRISSWDRYATDNAAKDRVNPRKLNIMDFKPDELWQNANERIDWHEKLDGDEAIQKRVHELVSVGSLEAAVSLLLTTPPEGPNFYPNALRAVALSSAVSQSLHELAVKVVAANMVRTDKPLSGTHLLCAVGRYQEACSQLQDAGCWVDAATLAATHLHGPDYARVLQRWADHVLRDEHNIWRALILYVAAGALPEALEALRTNRQPDTAAMFILACHEIYEQALSASQPANDEAQEEPSPDTSQKIRFPSKSVTDEDIIAVSEYYGKYQHNLVHLCVDATPYFD